MADVPTARSLLGGENTTHIDVESWTQRAMDAMRGMSLHADPSIPGALNDSSALQIPLDVDVVKGGNEGGETATRSLRQSYVLRRKSSQRDSLRRRDALLKGKEGSRQRRRWENDRLVGNPFAEPPLPVDWEVGYSHPVHSVPYYLAPLWDARYAKQNAAREAKANMEKKHGNTANGASTAGSVPRDLKEKMKRARGAKGLLQDIETEVRDFLVRYETQQRTREVEHEFEPDSSEDEEIVFVGRNGQMHDMPSSRGHDVEHLELKKLVFDSLENDQGASFGRWLVHSIGQYYGLETWSITTGDPARREAYVGIKDVRLQSGRGSALTGALPRPLWAMV